jgi:hypothetical protein
MLQENETNNLVELHMLKTRVQELERLLAKRVSQVEILQEIIENHMAKGGADD